MKFRIFISSVQSEKSGNGTESIIRRCTAIGLPTPEYHPDNVDFKAIIWRNLTNTPVAPVVAPDMAPVAGCSRGAVGVQTQGAVGLQPFRERCVELLRSKELTKKQIAERLGLVVRSGYLFRMLSELIADGLIEYTIPDKPNSRLQKYRLTSKGFDLHQSAQTAQSAVETGTAD